MDLWDDIEDDIKKDNGVNDIDFRSTESLLKDKKLSAESDDTLISMEDELQHLEIEDERSNGDRTVYINRELIFSNRYIDAIKSLGEDRICSKYILDSAREMLRHHHGDKYEDLYYIDAKTHKVLSRTDYRIKEREVCPSSDMKNMARNSRNIISIHNHPTDTLPSYEDIRVCFNTKYKYGLIMCHGGDIFQYTTLDSINKTIYEPECSIYYKREQEIAEKYITGRITEEQFKLEHQKSFIKLAGNLIDAGVILKEVLWNGKPQKQRDVSTNNR
jgi:proteasome lid subunit RPN8/RPN11